MDGLPIYAGTALAIIKEHPSYIAVFLPILLALLSRRWSAIVGCTLLALGGFAAPMWSEAPAFLIVGPVLSTLAGTAIALCAIQAQRAEIRTRSRVHGLMKRLYAAEQLIISLQERQMLHRIHEATSVQVGRSPISSASQPVVALRAPRESSREP
jgi:hypothetical protein